MTSDNTLLERVRKLLAKAEAGGTTPAEAEALTAKAAELMAKYGIDRALLAAARPETDQPADRVIDIANPGPGSRGTCCAGWLRRCAASASFSLRAALVVGSTSSGFSAPCQAVRPSSPISDGTGGTPTAVTDGGGAADMWSASIRYARHFQSVE
jgi:hypothetical protein